MNKQTPFIGNPITLLSDEQKYFQIKGIIEYHRRHAEDFSLESFRRIMELLRYTHNLGHFDGFEAKYLAGLIQEFIEQDHYEAKNIFTSDVTLVFCIYQLDRIWMHWKGIMLFSSL